ncbi:MAG: ABC transporter substrate-binding protein [Cyclobacteriaceae bacterium]|jgi:iron complex transport system substrate-binding protein|nr:ABC transporter substrate-binding protein [Cyclobacteriaceae bacterium]
MKRDTGYLIAAWLIAFGACTPEKKPDAEPGATTLKYATGFTVTQEGNLKRITITTPYPGAKEEITYLLVAQDESAPLSDANTQVIHVPIQSIVCTSTTHIPLLDYLDETNSLIGFPTTDYISSKKMRSRIDREEITDLGIDKGMNLELLYSLKPDLVMSYTMTGDLGQLNKLKELGIPVVVNAEYLETHPLGRAEWIKFMALFFNKEREADSVFNEIEREYLATQQRVAQAAQRPTVLSGIVYGDTWFMPGGKNYAARLLADAGTNYLWRETDSNSFLELSFESVYDKAKNADFWIGVGSFNSLAEIQAADSRYALFKPFQQGSVYTYNVRKGAKGGSEFLELGYLRPDWILKDLVKIAHPELLPDYELYFHAQLK